MAFEQFDYVIIGGGSAGCVLANRLTASGKHAVCLIEAGGADNHLYVTMPLGYGRAVGDPRFDWCYKSEPEPGLNGRRIAVPRGKVLGGSSSINAMAYVRGHRADFDHWRELGNVGWAWSDIVRCYQRIEDYDGASDDNRFKGGMMPVRRAGHVHLLSRKIIEASIEAGLPPTEDYNALEPEGIAIAQINASRGRRASSAAAYLRPARARSNLKVMTNTRALKLMFQGRRATGVLAERDGAVMTLRSRAEVILSAGAINSPMLLELSGVGQAERLSGLGVDVVCALPGVGENLQDHYFSGVRMRVKGCKSLNEEIRFPKLVVNALRYALFRDGLFGTTLSQLTGYARVSPDAERADIQFFGSASSMRAVTRPSRQEMKIAPDARPGASLGCYVCRPASRGSTHLASNSAYAAPRIVANHLTHAQDQEIMVKGLRLCRVILQQPALEPFRQAILSPGAEILNDEALLEFARAAGGSAYHIVGTCRMGRGRQAVVDERLRVHGVEGLRVVDSSIMPTLVSANTHAAAVAIAERGSDFILEAGMA